MRHLPLLLAFGSLTGALIGQANCSSSGMSPPLSLSTQIFFNGNTVYGDPGTWGTQPLPPTYTGFTFLFDLTLASPIDLTQIDILLYDDGGGVNLGGGMTVTSPNQVGNTTNAELWVYPGFPWMGNETNPMVWGLLGTGTLTVANRRQHSQAVFPAPITIPAGVHGFAFKVDMPTTGMNAGPLHPLLNASSPAPASFDGPGVTMNNLVFQRESWTSAPTPTTDWQNFELHYTLPSGYANWTRFGTGCVPPNDPVLWLQARPLLGTTVTMETRNIQAGTMINFWAFGLAPDPNGLPLGGFGLPGCNLYLQQSSPIITNATGVSAGVSQIPLVIPTTMSLSGVVVWSQAAPATPGFNSVGLLASNGVCIAVGMY